MGAQLRRGQRLLAHVVRRQPIDACLVRLWRLGVTDLGHDLVNARLIKLIVELRHCLVAGLLPEAHVPAIGHRVVVEAALLLVDIDADIVDETVGRAACV